MAKVLPVAEKRLLEQLLQVQADQFFRGSEFLNTAPDSLNTGDSAYFLRLLSIELTFKLIYLRDTDSLIFGHDLREIFDVMPRTTRDRIITLFTKRLRAKLEPVEFRNWLKYLGELFVKIRYAFDEFREMPIEEYEAKVKRFEEAAANDLSDASIVYHIDRVEALVGALQDYTEEQHGGRA